MSATERDFDACWNALSVIAGYLDIDVNDFDSDDGFEACVGRLQDRIIKAIDERSPQ